MTIDQFINYLTIDAEGHYPFQGYYKRKGGETTLISFLGMSTVQEIYAAIKQFITDCMDIEEIFFSMDFPAIQGMETEFVAVFQWQKGWQHWDGWLIPYTEDGTRLPLIDPEADCNALSVLEIQTSYFVKPWMI